MTDITACTGDRPVAPTRTIDVDLRVRLPAATPFVVLAAALDAMEGVLGGTWSYMLAPGQPRGRFEIDVCPEVRP